MPSNPNYLTIGQYGRRAGEDLITKAGQEVGGTLTLIELIEYLRAASEAIEERIVVVKRMERERRNN